MNERLRSTSEFYDYRGSRALDSPSLHTGSASVPPFLAHPYHHLDRILQQCRSDGAVTLLDLCCGRGAYAVFAAQLGYTVMGIDISSRSIEAARRLAQAHNLEDRCTFVVADALTWSPPHRFDVILIASSLYYLPLPAAIRFVRSSLADDGCFVCVETNGNNRVMQIYRRMRGLLRRDRDEQTLKYLLDKRGVALLEDSFSAASVTYYGFFTLCGVALVLTPLLQRIWTRAAGRMDELVLNRLRFTGLGFNFVFTGVNLRHSGSHGEARPGLTARSPAAPAVSAKSN